MSVGDQKDSMLKFGSVTPASSFYDKRQQMLLMNTQDILKVLSRVASGHTCLQDPLNVVTGEDQPQVLGHNYEYILLKTLKKITGKENGNFQQFR